MSTLIVANKGSICSKNNMLNYTMFQVLRILYNGTLV